MRTQDRPASSVVSGPFSHNMFLLVVVDRRNETWLCLLRWSVERRETEAVRLGAAGKHDALKRHTARGESVERIFQHSGIWLNSFSHRRFLDIGGADQVGHLIARCNKLCRPLGGPAVDADVRGGGRRPVVCRGAEGGTVGRARWVLR